MRGPHAVDPDCNGSVDTVQATLTWYRREELEQLARDYAAIRNLTMQPWGRVIDARGAYVSWGGWRGLIACLFTWQIIDSVSWKQAGRWERRYFLDLSGIS